MDINHSPTSQRHCRSVTCEIQANTGGGPCQRYCEARGRSSFRGQADDGGCGVQDERGQFTGEKDSTSNGRATRARPPPVQ
jgi:hypothetical protein